MRLLQVSLDSLSVASLASCALAYAWRHHRAMTGGCDMQDRPIMTELKDGLEQAGIEYVADDVEQADNDGEMHLQSVSWAVGDNEVTAMYGWCVDCDGESVGITKGWKFGYLEFYPNGVDGDKSYMATVDEILEDVR